MSEEEKKAIEVLKSKRASEQLMISGKMCVDILLNLIENQQKELDNLKEKYISKDKIRKEIEHYKFLQDEEYFNNTNRFTNQYFIYGDIIKILKRINGE